MLGLALLLNAAVARAEGGASEAPPPPAPCEEGVPVTPSWNAWQPDSHLYRSMSMLLPPRWKATENATTWASGRSRIHYGVHEVSDFPLSDRLVETCIVEGDRQEAYVSRYRPGADGILALALVGTAYAHVPVVLVAPESTNLAEFTTILRTMLGPYRVQQARMRGRAGVGEAGLTVRLKGYRGLDQDSEIGLRLAAELVNEGSEELRLVRPGIGSQQGLRTPFVSLHVSQRAAPVPFSTAIVEEADNVTEDDLVTLLPGHACFLHYLGTLAEVDVVGRMRVAWRYENHPGIGMEIREPEDAAVDERARATTPCWAASKPITIRVRRKPGVQAALREFGGLPR
jgi:hypothetical protein